MQVDKLPTISSQDEWKSKKREQIQTWDIEIIDLHDYMILSTLSIISYVCTFDF